MRIAQFLLIMTTAFQACMAYEVDQFTRRNEIPKDSLIILDQEINSRINEAIKEANSTYFRDLCNSSDAKTRLASKQAVMKKVSENLVNFTVDKGVIENFAERNNSISKRKIAVEESIYQGKESSMIVKKFGLAPVINVNNIQIGTDKLGHFFNEGWYIYKNNSKRTDADDRKKVGVVDSVYLETNYYGLKSTGIKSYGDMVANFDGHRFWEKFCNFNKDQVANPCGPQDYLQCNSQGKWELNPNQHFTLKDFVSAGWDESINCSSFSPEMADDIFNHMNKWAYTSKKAQPTQPCPIEPEKCVEIVEKYRGFNTKIVNPICRNVASAIKANKKIDPKVKFDYSYYDKKSTSSAVKPTSTNGNISNKK